MHHHRLSCSLNIFKFDMVVDDSFYRLNEQMIKNDSFAAAVFQKRVQTEMENGEMI